MLNATHFCVFGVIIAVTCVTSSPWRTTRYNKCEQDAEGGRSHLHYHLGVTDYDVNMNCSNGSLVWEYPTGGIRLHFLSQNHTGFEVCLKDGLLADHLNFFNETGGAHETLPSFTYSNPDMTNCIRSRGGEVTVLMMAPSMSYIAALDYYIQYSTY